MQCFKIIIFILCFSMFWINNLIYANDIQNKIQAELSRNDTTYIKVQFTKSGYGFIKCLKNENDLFFKSIKTEKFVININDTFHKINSLGYVFNTSKNDFNFCPVTGEKLQTINKFLNKKNPKISINKDVLNKYINNNYDFVLKNISSENKILINALDLYKNNKYKKVLKILKKIKTKSFLKLKLQYLIYLKTGDFKLLEEYFRDQGSGVRN